MQDKQITFRNTISQIKPSSLGRGWTATLFREVPGYGFYFSTYYQYKSIFHQDMTKSKWLYFFHSWYGGGLAGLVPWIFIYPSDVIKTKMQSEDIGFREAARKIYEESKSIRPFYRGYTTGLFRGFTFHGFVFLGYEIARSLIY
jgi:solute carrier family 25 carnitine/acylcarnitine transporter 20/29